MPIKKTKKHSVKQSTLGTIGELVFDMTEISMPDYQITTDIHARIEKLINREVLTEKLIKSLIESKKALNSIETAFNCFQTAYEDLDMVLTKLEFGDEK